MSLIPITAYPPEQQALMQAGGRWDLNGPWKFWIFAHSAPRPGEPDPGWTERGIRLGTRGDLIAAETAEREGLDDMITIGFITGYILLLVPNGWDPRAPFHDAVLTFPDHT